MRSHLGNKNAKRKEIDIRKVYACIDSGETVAKTADRFNVSVPLLYVRHKEYQDYLQTAEGILYKVSLSKHGEKTFSSRKSLSNRKNGKRILDMNEVYCYLDAGHTKKAAAKHFGVLEKTLYRRHKEYQRSLMEGEERDEG